MLKQKPKDFSLNELLIALRIEEKHHKILNFEYKAKAHIVKNLSKPKLKFFKKNNYNKPNFNKSRGKNNNHKGFGSTPC